MMNSFAVVSFLVNWFSTNLSLHFASTHPVAHDMISQKTGLCPMQRRMNRETQEKNVARYNISYVSFFVSYLLFLSTSI